VLRVRGFTIEGELVEFGSEALDAAGYDLLALVTGSEGMLAVTTEVTVKLVPKPELARVIMASFDDLEKAAAVLAWDRDVNMPRAGLTGRVQQMTTLSRLIHAGFTADETGTLIEAAAAELDGAGYDSNGAALIRTLRRSYADATRLPTEYVERRTRISGEARHA
jgi:glycolate oxidase